MPFFCTFPSLSQAAAQRMHAMEAALRERFPALLLGASTVREVFEAQQGGAAVIKLFPGEVLGPAFVWGLLGLLPYS